MYRLYIHLQMSIPSSVTLPAEMSYIPEQSLPVEARSFQIAVQPSNVSSIVSSAYSMTASSVPLPAQNFPAQQVNFQIPCGGSPSQFLDTRFSSLSFRATATVVSAGSSSLITSGYQKSGGYSFFDRMQVIGGNGQILEDIAEYGLVMQKIIDMQFNNSTKDSLALQYGFNSGQADNSTVGHTWSIFTQTSGPTANNTESHSYDIPLIGVLGSGTDKMINIGRLNGLMLSMTTTSILPITITTGTCTTASTISITLSNFALNLAIVDIGAPALSLVDNTLTEGKAYIHGNTWRVSSTNLPSAGGAGSLQLALRGSSVKSLFVFFADTGALAVTASYHGKYDSYLPSMDRISFSIGGIQYPQNLINPLLYPASAMAETTKAMGSFNNFAFSPSLIPSTYCKLSPGGTAQALSTGTFQDYTYTVGSLSTTHNQFIFGVNTEVVCKKNLMSGINASNAPLFLQYNCALASTNSQTVYGMALLDSILVHDIHTREMSIRV
jgi:hypothetical protein